MTTNKNSQVGSGDVQNQLALVALILIYGRVGGIEESKQIAHNGDGHVGNSVELLVSQLLASLIATSDLGILPGDLLYGLLSRNLFESLQ